MDTERRPGQMVKSMLEITRKVSVMAMVATPALTALSMRDNFSTTKCRVMEP